MNRFLHWVVGWIIVVLGLAAMLTVAFATLLLALLAASALIENPTIIDDARFAVSILMAAAVLMFLWIMLDRIHTIFTFRSFNKASATIIAKNEDKLLDEARRDPCSSPEEDSVRFALYLRGFSRRSYFGYRWSLSPKRWRHILTAGQDFETDLFMILMHWGIPMIKVGEEDGLESGIDGLSVRSSSDDWWPVVTRLAENAGIILITPSPSAGLREELALILSDESLVRKSFILFPPARNFWEANMEIACALGFSRSDLRYNFGLCNHEMIVVPAAELFDFLARVGAQYKEIPTQVKINQLPYGNFFRLGHYSSPETIQALNDLLVFTGKGVGEISPMWIFTEARAEAEQRISKQLL